MLFNIIQMTDFLEIHNSCERMMQPSINPSLSETNRFNKPVEEILRNRSHNLNLKTFVYEQSSKGFFSFPN